MTSLNEKTSLFRKLHGPGEILVLPNAWDAGSARLIEETGAKAIATSSAALPAPSISANTHRRAH
jgi:2-methylisocitrate lyase-like PEP mutase family enzyme